MGNGRHDKGVHGPTRRVLLGQRTGLPRRWAFPGGKVEPGATLLGALPRTEALRWIAHAGALLVTSSAEGAPTVVREARALGVPVVTTDVGDVAAWAARDPEIVVVRESPLDATLGRAVREIFACRSRRCARPPRRFAARAWGRCRGHGW